MDISKLSTEDLVALKAGRLSDVSTEGLQAIRGVKEEPRPDVDMSTLDSMDARSRVRPEPTTTQKLWSSLPGRGLQGGLDVVDAGAQLLANTFGSKSEADRINQIARQRGLDYEQAKYATGFEGTDIARPVGSAVAQMLMTRGLGAPSAAASLPAKVGLGSLFGAGFGALQPVTEGDFWKEKAKQTGVGALSGAAAVPITEVAARVVRPMTSEAVKLLRSEGVAPTVGQILGGTAKSMEEKLSSLPILGSVIRSGQDRANLDLNKAVWNRVLAPIGEKLPAGTLGRDAVSYSDDVITKAYEKVLGKIGAVKIDTKLGADMTTLSGMVNHLPKERGQQFVQILRSEIGDRIENGTLTGDAIKKADSNLRSIGETYIRSSDADQRTIGAALLQARKNLIGFLGRASPFKDELKSIDTSYANFIRALKASSGVGAQEGVFSPAQLQAAVRAADPTKHKKSFAKGGALMQDLSDAASSVLQNRVPNSGTADRALASGMALAPGALAAMASSPAFVGAAIPTAMYAPGIQRLLAGALTSRPAIAEPVADVIRKSSPVTTGLLYPFFAE